MTTSIDVVRIRARLSRLLAEYRTPSASIAVLRDGEVTEVAAGLKSLATGEPATPATIYQCGSMSKTWTALAFMQLVDEGKVRLDEPVRTYLPDFKVADPAVSAGVTPRHLLNHTSGIEEEYGDPGEGDDVYERMVAGASGAPQVHPLGRTHGYSPALGYAILARIMEVVDGRRWDDIMKERLFAPLRLTATSSRPEQVNPERAATGYVARSPEEGPIESPVPWLPRAYGPGGNVSSTAREVVAMAHVLLHGGRAMDGTPILSADSVREMTESRVPVPDPYIFGSEWALGLTVYHWDGETVYAHDGNTIGQSARLRILPSSKTAIAMLANGGLRDGFYREVFNDILAELGAVGIPELPRPLPSLRLDVSRYEGSYGRPGVRYEVTGDNGRLALTFVPDPVHARVSGMPERARYELLPLDETHFLVPSGGPLEDPQTVAIYDFGDGAARYLHTGCRVNPRLAEEL